MDYEYLFSYGTLQKADVQVRLFGRELTGAKDILNGYKVLPIKIEDDAFLAKGEAAMQLTLRASSDEADFVEGTALQITGDELAIVDKYEPREYLRKRVTLASGTRAWVYAVEEKLAAN